jgi:deazaflavin-dependent oxidoreductase (nitroreductase family)
VNPDAAPPAHAGDPETRTGERLAYPRSAWLRQAYRLPILLHRLGLSGLTGRLFLILTTTGRKSGLPRRTAIEFHTVGDRKYVLAAWKQADWYRNLQADPRVRLQTAWGAQAALARRVTKNEELARWFRHASRNPVIRWMARSASSDLTLATFLAEKERWILIAFDAADEPAPPPLQADLVWIWPALALSGWLVWMMARNAG